MYYNSPDKNIRFNSEPPERGEPEERIEKRKRLDGYLEQISKKLREQGLPVDSTCRVEMSAFKNVYTSIGIEADKKHIEKGYKQWYPNKTIEEGRQEKEKSDGSILEKLKTAIFYKNLNDKCFVFRSSEYDDFENGVDNIIMDKETGRVVCALDEVRDTMGPEYTTKVQKVIGRNKADGGAKLKYSFSVKSEEGEVKVVPSEEIRGIPVFYLAVSKNVLDFTLREFNNSNEQSNKEKLLFKYFMSTIDSQIINLELNQESLLPGLKERLEFFKEVIHKLK